MNDIAPDTTTVRGDVSGASETAGDARQPTFRPLLDLIPGMPSGQVCGPDGCAPQQ